LCPRHTLQAYPAILVTAGLHDPRVGYWEPAKYVATLRKKTRDMERRRPVLLKIDMGAGHFSMSGRFDQLKEVALDMAFTLKQLGLADSKPM
jgi:oligopeptidase B